MTNPAETKDSSQSQKEVILIVDDIVDNLKILDSLLSKAGFKVKPAISGKLALNAVKHQQPDLILLDINMPEIDGYEVCRRLKSDPSTCHIPVIFLSGFNDFENRIKGLEIGAVDYISKPFNTREVLLRIETQLSLQRSQKKLEEQNRHLERMTRLQSEVAQLICHDMKGPLSPILSFPKKIRQLSSLSSQQNRLLVHIEKCGYKLLQLIDHSKNLSQMENRAYHFSPVPVDVVTLLENILFDLQPMLEIRKVKVRLFLNKKTLPPGTRFFIQGEELLCYTMLSNLIKNAIEASLSTQQVEIQLSRNDNQTISIHNDLPVPEEIRGDFFGKFTTSGKNGGSGLGTYSAKLTAKAQGGVIEMQTSKKFGTTVSVVFPLF
jgi:two-component system, sensor histidine kinase and response regulator